MPIEDRIEINSLFDFYGPLLTEKQQDYLKLYYQQDYSLGEIADDLAVSRQAVYDNIKRSEKILKDYEKTLHLVADFQARERELDKLASYVKEHYGQDQQLQEFIDKISLER